MLIGPAAGRLVVSVVVAVVGGTVADASVNHAAIGADRADRIADARRRRAVRFAK